MAVTKITYENKEAIQNDASVANKSKVTDDDMNEIKKVVNNNADEVTGMQENIEDLQDGQGSANADITSLKNRVNTLESNVSNLENNKVDKIEGKSLSTEDFTTELKTKLEGLNNYDDTEIKEDISEIKQEQQTQNSDIENLQTNDNKQDELISKLKNALINVETEESKSLHVSDSNRFGSLEVLGNQEQETRSGKNLFDKNNMNILQGYIDGSGSIIYNTSNKIAYIECPKNTDITVSGKYLRGIACYNQLPTYNLQTSVKNINQATCLTLNTGDNTYLAVWYYENNSGYTEQEITDTVQVEVGNVATEYEQYGASPSPDYPSPVVCLGSNTDGSFKGSTEIKMKNADETQEKSYTLPIQQEMLKGDYFVKEADGWKEVHNYNKKEFDGTEEIALTSNSNSFTCVINDMYITSNFNELLNFYSNHYIKSTWTERNVNNKENTIASFMTSLGFYKGKLNTTDQFKQQLSNWKNEGNPLVVYYPLSTSNKLPCTKEQSAVLEELSNLDLFEGVNNIITAEDIALLKLKYALDVEIYVDNKIDEKLANINQQILNIAGGN